MIFERVRDYLLSDATIAAAVQDDEAGEQFRIRPDQLAEGDSYPAIVVEVTDEDPLEMLSETGGLQKAKVTFAALDSTRTGATSLGKKIRDKIDGLPATVDGARIDGTFEGRKNGSEPNQDGSDSSCYWSEIECEIWWDDAT